MKWFIHKKTLGVLIAFFVFVAAVVISVSGQSENKLRINEEPSISQDIDSVGGICSPKMDIPCQDKKGHSKTSGTSSHCQHCGHSQTGVLSSTAQLIFSHTLTKVSDFTPNPPQNIALDKPIRPPNS